MNKQSIKELNQKLENVQNDTNRTNDKLRLLDPVNDTNNFLENTGRLYSSDNIIEKDFSESPNEKEKNKLNSSYLSVLQSPPLPSPKTVLKNSHFWMDEVEQECLNNENRFRDDEECLDFCQFDPKYDQKLKKDNYLFRKLNEIQKKVDKQNNKDEKDHILKLKDLFKEYSQTDDNEEVSKLESGRITKFFWYRTKHMELAHLIMTMITLALSLFYFTCDVDELLKEKEINQLLQLLWGIQFIDYIVIICRYKAVMDLEIHQQNIPPASNLKNSGYLKYMALECLILGIQPVPFFNNYYLEFKSYYEDAEFDYKLNWTLTLLSMSRIFVVIRHILQKNQFMTTRGNRICKMYGCQASYQFTLKCYFKDQPLQIITILFVISVFFFAFLFRISEGRLFTEIEDNSMDFNQIINCVWASVITMTTVGYGDYFSKAVSGRLLTVIISIWGNIIVSLLVVILTNLLEPTRMQSKTIFLLHKLFLRKDLKIKTANLATSLAKFHRLIEKRREAAGVDLDERYVGKRDWIIQKKKEAFQLSNRKLKCMNEQQNVGEEMCRQFDYLDREIEWLKQSQKHLCQVLDEIYRTVQFRQEQEPEVDEIKDDINEEQDKIRHQLSLKSYINNLNLEELQNQDDEDDDEEDYDSSSQGSIEDLDYNDNEIIAQKVQDGVSFSERDSIEEDDI